MNKDTIFTTVVVSGMFLLSLVLVIFADGHEEEQAAIAKQLAYEKWSQNDLFMNTLERYNEIYHRLSEQRDKEALARAYVEMLTTDLFLFPSKNRKEATLSVLLPAAKEGDINKPFVLQQMYIGADNGIYDALKHLIVGSKRGLHQEPPYYSPDTDLLMEYIKTGSQLSLYSFENEQANPLKDG